MKPGLFHLSNNADMGGAETGIVFLAEEGFYAPFETHIVLLFRGNGRMLSRLPEAYRKRVTILCDVPKMRVWHFPVMCFRLWKLLRRKRPKVMICSLPQANLIGRPLGRICGVKIVNFVHNLHFSKWFYRALLSVTNRLVQGALTDGEATRKLGIKRFSHVPEDRVRIVPLMKLRARTKAQLAYAANSIKGKEAPLQMAVVGRLTKVKNVALAIEMLALLRRQRAAELHVFGDGAELANLQQQAEMLGVAGDVQFHGYVPDWQEKVLKMDIFLQCSRFEGAALSIMEALSLGIAVACTPVGGVLELAQDKNNLLLMTMDDAAANVRKILHYADNRALLADLGREGRKAVLQIYGEKEVTQKLFNAAKMLEKLASDA